MTVDQELRLRALEEEQRHHEAMRRLQGDRLDAHDRSIAAIAGVAADIKQIAVEFGTLNARLAAIDARLVAVEIRLDKLIDVLRKDHTNGGEPKA